MVCVALDCSLRNDRIIGISDQGDPAIRQGLDEIRGRDKSAQEAVNLGAG